MISPSRPMNNKGSRRYRSSVRSFVRSSVRSFVRPLVRSNAEPVRPAKRGQLRRTRSRTRIFSTIWCLWTPESGLPTVANTPRRLANTRRRAGADGTITVIGAVVHARSRRTPRVSLRRVRCVALGAGTAHTTSRGQVAMCGLAVSSGRRWAEPDGRERSDSLAPRSRPLRIDRLRTTKMDVGVAL